MEEQKSETPNFGSPDLSFRARSESSLFTFAYRQANKPLFEDFNSRCNTRFNCKLFQIKIKRIKKNKLKTEKHTQITNRISNLNEQKQAEGN